MTVTADARGLQDDIVRLRHRLHQEPEIGLDLPRTQEKVLEALDGLPVQEATGVDYSSRVDGAMHACGHDLHTAMLAGAATLLAERRHQLAGDVVLMFQPGEEGCDDAGVMIREGVLDAAGKRPDAASGTHVMAGLEPNARFFTKPDILTSASDGLFVTVHGAGGHGSTPLTC